MAGDVTEQSRPPRSGAVWRQYAGYFRAHGKRVAAVALAGAAQSFAYVPFAAVLRRTFDVVLPARDRLGLLIAVGELLALQAGSLALAWWAKMTALAAGQEVLARLRRRCVRRFYVLPREFHTAADAERLHVSVVYETEWIEGMNNALTAQVLPAALSALVLFALLFAIEPRYAVIIGVAAPSLFIANRLMTREAWFRQERLRLAFEAFSRGVRFALAAVDLTRSHAAEAREFRRQSRNIDSLRRVSLGVARFDAGQQLLQTALLVASTVAVLLAGGWAVAQGRSSAGQIMTFYVVTALFASQARSIVDSVPAVRRGIWAFRRLDILLRQPEREPYTGRLRVEGIDCVQLEHVGFHYRGAPALVQDATLEVRRGERVALIGPNGCGKSTLLFLILGFYRPQTGTLSVNGIPYEQLDMRRLRSRCATVPQHPFLFAETVRANVAYGSDALADEAIWEALRWAGAAEFVEALPEGLDSEIGEQGVRLSGGQKQRLAIARALLRRPDLLILDEPTNHLDEEGVSGLMDRLDRLPFQPAVLLVSHEWHILRHAHRAWRLTGGRLEEAALECRN